MPREFILLMGTASAGKSYAILKMIEAMPEHHFYVIDSDLAYEAMTDGRDFRNLTIYPVTELPEMKRAIIDIRKHVKPGDWIVPDMIDCWWDAAQRYFVDSIFDQDFGDYILQARKAMETSTKSGGLWHEAFQGYQDWPAIKGLYFDLWNKIKSTDANIIATARSEELNTTGKFKDAKEMVMLGNATGVKPAGEKKLAHQFHSIFYLERVPEGWRITTWRERFQNRVWMKREPLENFFTDYGEIIANW